MKHFALSLSNDLNEEAIEELMKVIMMQGGKEDDINFQYSMENQ